MMLQIESISDPGGIAYGTCDLCEIFVLLEDVTIVEPIQKYFQLHHSVHSPVVTLVLS